jgi:hypothetical protein
MEHEKHWYTKPPNVGVADNLPRSGNGLERGRPARLSVLGNRTSLEGTPRRVGEHLPIRFGKRKVGNRPPGFLGE